MKNYNEKEFKEIIINLVITKINNNFESMNEMNFLVNNKYQIKIGIKNKIFYYKMWSLENGLLLRAIEGVEAEDLVETLIEIVNKFCNTR